MQESVDTAGIWLVPRSSAFAPFMGMEAFILSKALIILGGAFYERTVEQHKAGSGKKAE